MAGTGERHCVLVLRLGEVCSSTEEEVESARSEVGPETLQVVGPELIDHDDHDQLRPRDRLLRQGDTRKDGEEETVEPVHRAFRRSNSARASRMVPKTWFFSSAVFQSRLASTAASSRPIQ